MQQNLFTLYWEERKISEELYYIMRSLKIKMMVSKFDSFCRVPQ